MRKLTFLLAIGLFMTSFTYADDDLWVDVNFTRDSTLWLGAVPDLAVKNYDFLTTLAGEYLDYKMNGAFGRFAVVNFSYTPFNVENLEEKFIYAFRMHNNEDSYWAFPGTSDVGSVKLNFMCGNKTAAGEIKVQYFDGMEEIPGQDGGEPQQIEIWKDFNPAVVFEVPPHDNSTSSFVAEKVLNLTEPSKLRLKGPTLKNVHIFAASISKNKNSGVQHIGAANFSLKVDGRSIKVVSNINVYETNVYDLSGNLLTTLNRDASYSFNQAGIYMVKVTTNEGSVTRKVTIM
ncbi:hypothetical protein MASR2M117_21010 [Paludibacter sp.]